MHTRRSDEEILMRFAERRGSHEFEVMGAVQRLKDCHDQELQDYGVKAIPEESNRPESNDTAGVVNR